MKKIILLLICSVFSVAVNAQNLIVTNSTTGNIDVVGIAKLTSTCVTTSYCPMADITNFAPGTNSWAYPGSCSTTPNIMLTLTIGGVSVNIQYCGTQQTGTCNGYSYILDIVGAGPDVKLYVY